MDNAPVDLPQPIQSLFESLRQRGFRDAQLGNQRPTGPDRLRMVNGDMSVRVSLRGSDWILALNCRAWGGEWFDAAVVRAALDHESAEAPDDPALLSAFIVANLDSRLADSPASQRLKDDLVRLEGLRRQAAFGHRRL